MKNNEIEAILIKSLLLDEIYVNNDGSHYEIIAVSKEFAHISLVDQQKLVYAPLIPYISNASIHSLSIKTYTPKEWECARKFY
ncbi:BolA family transcriptional regulator [Blochmannia endosymbiont of Colobopsis nipponica]|uniref:BolA family protein n=1 Tax=Blochmannia endosymbiont of Colobopsis nipponica TaxID=2681987 RepID=UPI00177F307D|nr:BolA family protein [Blochmannia endosymbiont of Colobopsis nipponica]QOI10804.1 BolA family transcriptional regulator [Blochmannia endosymbiont of Colobopsis nipponica]